MLEYMKLFLLAAMTILPGSWLTFGISLDELNWRTRLALGAALSPIVLAIQLYLLRILHVDFAPAVLVILFINLPCLILIKRNLPRINFRGFSTAFWVASLILSSLIGLMLTLWVFIPNLRTVSWHALVHADIIYLISRNPFLPEEPDMANIALAAPWLDHVYWSITGWLTDWPPTVIYPISNIIWLIIAFVLAYELASQGLGLQNPTALLSVGFTFIGTNVVGAVGFLVSGKWEFLGDIRYTPLLGKYFAFETIPFALALVIGLSLVCALILEKNTKSLWSLAPILLIALGIVYPILFPVGCLLVAFTMVLLWKPSSNNSQHVTRIGLLLGIGFLVSLFVFLAYLPAITAERSVSTFQFHTLDTFKTNTRYAVAALLPFLIFGSPFIIRGVLFRRRSTILLTLAGLGCIGLYLLFGLSNLEYKFILAATLLLMPLAAGGIEVLVWQSVRLRWILSAMTPPALALFFAFLIFKTEVHIPDNLANTPKILEDSFWLQLDRKEGDSGWTGAVRRLTPEDTILVLHSSRINIASFANRALFFPGFGDGDAMAGYSVQKDYYFLEQRGYSRVSYDFRSKTVQALYTETDVAKLAEVVSSLLTFHRPIAIHFLDRDTPSLIWMKQNNIGSQLYSDSKNVIWFINRRSNSLESRLSAAIPLETVGKISRGE
jgi:hypothetical protein